MKIQYTPKEEDYINLKMFATSQNRNIMRQLNIQKYIAYTFIFIFIVFIVFEYSTKGRLFPCIFFFLIIVFFIFFTRFTLWLCIRKIKKEFNKFDKSNAVVELSIDNQDLKLSDRKGEYTMKTSDIKRFIEVQKYFFIQMQEGLFLSIPKEQIEDSIGIQAELKQYAKEYKIPYIIKLDWIRNFYNKKSKI